MEKYTTYLNDGIITIQESDYIEDGWYIEIDGNKITLFVIPVGGGEPSKFDEYETLIEAIEATKTIN